MAANKQEKGAVRLKVTLIKSTIGSLEKHKKTVQALGLRKIRQSVIVQDIPAMRGMLEAVRHLVKVEEVTL